MDITNDPGWLRLQLEADAAIATDQLLHGGPAACDDYLAAVGYSTRYARLQQLEAAK